MNLPKTFKNKLKAGEPLKRHTTFRIGGRAQYWYEPKDKRDLVRFIKQSGTLLPFFVIGAGSNLLIEDRLIKKIFIHLKHADFNKIKIAGTSVSVGAGVKMGRLISILSSKDLGGYEFLAGIPGTIGGALAMNAGAASDSDHRGSYREMKDIITQVDCLDREGRFIRLKRKDIKFSYRNSSLRPYIILGARLKLAKADKNKVRAIIRTILKNRREKQDWQYPSAGSFFKNPKNTQPAGRLIDLCRLKGLRVGDAQISEKHANFIINKRHARCADVIKLMDAVRERVYDRFKIKLDPEVEIVS